MLTLPLACAGVVQNVDAACAVLDARELEPPWTAGDNPASRARPLQFSPLQFSPLQLAHVSRWAVAEF